MKNPNGYGSVVKLSGNRRRPFMARKTVGWNDKGQPIYKAIGYYVTRQEAMIALGEYNRTPYDIDLSKITLAEIFERWSKRDFSKLSKSSCNGLKTAFKHAERLHNHQYKIIKAYQMQDIIDNCGAGYATQNNIKNLFSHLDKYALELDIIVKMNSMLTHTAPVTPKEKQPFEVEEVKTLWENEDFGCVDMILILIYTGYRIGELLSLKTVNINLTDETIRGGIKTQAGKDRIVPIHPLIKPLIEKHYNPENKLLFKMSYSTFLSLWKQVMVKFNMHHTPHETRHTFRTRLDNLEANKVCIDLIMGHKSNDTGEREIRQKDNGGENMSWKEELAKRIFNLLCIKSLVTLGVIFGGLYFLRVGVDIPDWLVAIITLVVKSYFDSQTSKTPPVIPNKSNAANDNE